MIEIRKNPDPQSKIEYLLFIDGVLLENAPISSSADGYWITVRDFETSAKIAKHSLSEFPPFRYIHLTAYPEGIQHFSKSDGAFIHRDWKKNEKTGKYEDTGEYTVSLPLGKSALSQWCSPYSFADYACEMYQFLEYNIWVTGLGLVNPDHTYLDNRRDGDDEGYPTHLKEDIDQIDKTRIYGLDMMFRYSSPEVKIDDELKRISIIINEAHARVVSLLVPKDAPIQIIKKGGTQRPYQLLINASPIAAWVDEETLYGVRGTGLFSIRLPNLETLFAFGSVQFLDIPPNVRGIEVSLGTEFHSKFIHIKVSPSAYIATPAKNPNDEDDGYSSKPSPFGEDYSICFFYSLDVYNWKGKASPNDFLNEISHAFNIKEHGTTFIHGNGLNEYEFTVDIRITPNSRVVEEVLRWRDYLRQIFDTVEDNLASTPSSNSIVKSFNFPEEVGTACEQYLLYFTGFLRDLGVKATSDITHEAGQVLFTVTPTNEVEALDKIRTALDVYLHLPASPVNNDMSNEIAIQRLESQVLRFQSDLRLAAAELQAKNATIEAQQLTITVQKALLNGEILLDSMKDVTPTEKEDERVEFFDGSVALTVYKDKGVEFNWAKMWKQLKEMFLDKDKK